MEAEGPTRERGRHEQRREAEHRRRAKGAQTYRGRTQLHRGVLLVEQAADSPIRCCSLASGLAWYPCDTCGRGATGGGASAISLVSLPEACLVPD
jgi:hypothetical protein